MAKQSKNWVFTINNPTLEDDPMAWVGVKYLVYQKECGKEETPHYQGYVVFNSMKRMSGLKKINSRAHWENRRGTHVQAKEYCMKEEGRLEGPWEKGEEPKVPGRNSTPETLLEDLKKHMTDAELLENHTGFILRYGLGRISTMRRILKGERNWMTECCLIWGEPGVGKSRWVHENFPDAYWKSQDKWFDGYNGEDVVVLDDYRGYLPLTVMNTLINGVPATMEVKGGKVQMVAKLVIITANCNFTDFYKPKVWGNSQQQIETYQYSLGRRIGCNFYWGSGDPNAVENLNTKFDATIKSVRRKGCDSVACTVVPEVPDNTEYSPDKYTTTVEPPRERPKNDDSGYRPVKRMRKGQRDQPDGPDIRDHMLQVPDLP